MKKNVFILSLGIAALAFSSCTTSKPASVKDLTGEWSVVAIDGTKVTMPENLDTPYLAFDTANGRLFGNASCNNIMGSFSTESPEGQIELSGIASTRMGCPDMTLEDGILGALDKTKTLRMAENGDIELCSEAGVPLLTLAKREASFSAANLAGQWTVVQVGEMELTPEQSEVCTIRFDNADHSFGCTTDCNTLGGSYKSEFVDFTFDVTLSTMKMCPDTAVEDALKVALPKVTSFSELQEGRVAFYDADNSMMLVIEKK